MGNRHTIMRPHHIRLIYLREFAGYKGEGAIGALTNDYNSGVFARKVLDILEGLSTDSSAIIFTEGLDDICAGMGPQCPRMSRDCKPPHGSAIFEDRRYIQNLGLELNRSYSYKDILNLLRAKDVSFILEEVG